MRNPARAVRWRRWAPLVLVPAALACLWLFRTHPDDAPPPPEDVVAADDTFALLVGCTEYPGLKQVLDAPTYEAKVRLAGPENDVALLRTTLCDYLGVPRAHVSVLSGWPDDEAGRPTRANILAHLERLAREVPRGGRVVFAFAGHGSQQRDLDGDEPDGLDELILPADVERWNLRIGAVPGAITDDELRVALTRLRDAGLSVWAVLDCCHSGTLARGGDVRTRDLAPSLLGVPETEAPAAYSSAPDRLLPGTQDDLSGIVAFYAVQSHQLAPEMTLPTSLLARDRRTHGLFTFLLARQLQRMGGSLSFRELYEQVLTAYKAMPWEEAAPLAEGDLNRLRVGGGAGVEGPAPAVVREGGELVIESGELQGLTEGSRLDLYRPGRLGVPQGRIGALTVVKVGLTRSVGQPVAGDFPEDHDRLPPRCPALLTSLAPGALRVPLAVVQEPGTRVEGRALPPALELVLLDPVMRARLPLVAPEQAAWVLRVVAPDGTREDGAPRLVLEPGPLTTGWVAQECDAETLGERLDALVRAAGLRQMMASAALGPPPDGFKVAFGRGPPGSDAQEPLVAGAACAPQDRIAVRVENLTGKDLDVRVLSIDANQDVGEAPATWGASGRLTAADGKEVLLGPWPLADGALGDEQLLLLVAPRSPGAPPLDVRALSTTLSTARAAQAQAARQAAQAQAAGVQGRGGPTERPGEGAGLDPSLTLASASWRAGWGSLDPAAARSGALRLDPPALSPTSAAGAPTLPGDGATWEQAVLLAGERATADVLLMWGPEGSWGAWVDVERTGGWSGRALADLAREAASGALGARLVVQAQPGRVSARYVRPVGEPCEALILVDETGDGAADRRFVQRQGAWHAGRAWGPWLNTQRLGGAVPARRGAALALRRLLPAR